jgi:DNA adenine methylase
MKYQGGKTKCREEIVEAISSKISSGPWWEPFCGGLSVSVALTDRFGPGKISDANLALISLYQAILHGWQPPEVVTREMYEQAKVLPDSDPLKAFCGFACSFGGKWFGGYVAPKRYEKTERCNPGYCNYPKQGKRALLRDVPLVGVTECLDFMKVKPGSVDVKFIYCDPPYEGSLKYSGGPKFNSQEFFARCVDWSDAGVSMFISEHACPVGEMIWSKPHKTRMLGGSGPTHLEKLFYLEGRVK